MSSLNGLISFDFDFPLSDDFLVTGFQFSAASQPNTTPFRIHRQIVTCDLNHEAFRVAFRVGGSLDDFAPFAK